MKYRRFVKIMALLLTMVLSGATAARAQVFIMDEHEFNNSARTNGGSSLPPIPTQDITTDQYTPVGSGIGLLMVMGAAFALAKKKHDGK